MSCRYSAGARAGQTGTQATHWSSDTSAACRVAAGAGGSLALTLTLGGGAGSETETASYDLSEVSSVAGLNARTTGSWSMALSGSGLGTLM